MSGLVKRMSKSPGDMLVARAAKGDTYSDSIQAIRSQEVEQLKLFQHRTESKVAFMQDVQEFLKKRAEVEQEYAQKLDKVAEKFAHKLKHTSYGRYTLLHNNSLSSPADGSASPLVIGAAGASLPSPLVSPTSLENAVHPQTPVDVWTVLIENCRKTSRSRAALATRYGTELLDFTAEMERETVAGARQCHDYGLKLHAELSESLAHLETTAHSFHGLSAKAASAKAKVEDAKKKLESGSVNSKIISMLGKNVEKELHKREDTAAVQERRASNAFNDYLFAIDVANAHKNQFFEHEIVELTALHDRFYHENMNHFFNEYAHIEGECATDSSSMVHLLKVCTSNIDGVAEREAYMTNYAEAFRAPANFALVTPSDHAHSEIIVTDLTRENLKARQEKLSQRSAQLALLEAECSHKLSEVNAGDQERKKALYGAHFGADKHAAASSATSTSSSGTSPLPVSPTASSSRSRNTTPAPPSTPTYVETHLTKSLYTAQLLKTQAQLQVLGRVPSDSIMGPSDAKRRATLNRSSSTKGSPKVFGVELADHLRVVERSTPLLVDSCIATIEDFGILQEGIFRLSGSAVAIKEMRASFDRGLDPLVNEEYCQQNIHAVAGVLKLYFRELPTPLFPFEFYEPLINIIRYTTDHKSRAVSLRELLKSLPKSNLLVLERLFDLLVQIAQQGELNKMKAHNLAIVFGPTLIRAPADNLAAMVADTGSQCQIVSMIIQEHAFLFGETNEFVDRGVDQPDETGKAAPGEEEEPVEVSRDDDDADVVIAGVPPAIPIVIEPSSISTTASSKPVPARRSAASFSNETSQGASTSKPTARFIDPKDEENGEPVPSSHEAGPESFPPPPTEQELSASSSQEQEAPAPPPPAQEVPEAPAPEAPAPEAPASSELPPPPTPSVLLPAEEAGLALPAPPTEEQLHSSEGSS
ncbi:hypothetical protein CAOG_08784 [Capsaspora owczarzaki ATCC 30864]|uniref:Rho-GAP domain-containing protein n=1 Tax=Capsaspora owczarzaki (strain ATCC 30864) TaxID=595528 RepID=A0A0D2UF69_CAPO3|nr:hypothetical protein CAOG_08784 [Capsaspora owczarzaki ATCC 30864]KJE93746.1 hypothetical protein CAOG_008784 [Capsaspora owczarzaki ATCC 30864]|eukprot:XP_011270414.1 hypothetical protein CAOG_08784 [Capsaspora owczarzaki ATCC 30864]